MFNINDYLKKFSKTIGEASFKKDEVIKIFEEKIKVSISKDDIQIKDGILFLKVKPITKSEIMLKKQKLLEAVSVLNIFEIKFN